MSNRLKCKVCDANLAGSFALASRLLESLAGLHISPKRAQLITESVGQDLAAQRDLATQAFLTGSAPSPPPPEPVSLMVLACDGGRVQTRQSEPTEKWKEDKVGVVYDATPAPEQPGVRYHGPPPQTRSITATMGNWDRLGEYLSALADRRGYAYAKQKVFVSDGASGIRSLRERCFPDAAFILDWAHAAQHLYACGVAGFGPGSKAQDWVERQKQRLWEGRIPALLGQLTRLAKQLGPPPKGAADNDPRRILANNVEYFRTNRAGLDYPTFRRNGWPIGSGIIESTIKVVGKRVKGTEKHWNLHGVEQTLQVVTHLMSDDGSWEAFWRPASEARRA